MQMTGQYRIDVARGKVWEALNDPAVLQAAIPGCESVERIGDDQFQAKVSMKLGQAMYEASQAEAAEADAQKSGEDVVDADFEEIDENDDKKKSA